MPNPNDLTARCLFRFNVNDGLNGQSLLARSFATEIAAVFSRAATKYIVDQNGLLVPIAAQVVPVTVIGTEKAVLLEPAATNLCIRSEEFDTWTDTSSCTVTANAAVAPDGALTMDLLTATGTTSHRRRTVTFTADGEKCLALYFKAGSSAANRWKLRDTTAGTDRHSITVTWVAGVPTIATTAGSGTRYPVEALGGGLYRVLISVAGVVAANTNEMQIFPDPDGAGTGSVYAWGAQAENAVVPSSYIKTEGTTVTRAADSAYFEVPGLNPPRAMTIYSRIINRGGYVHDGLNKRALQIGSSGTGTDPRFATGQASGGQAFAQYDDGVTEVSATATLSAVALGSVVEQRSVLTSDWKVQTGSSVAGAAEVVGSLSGASALSASWAAARLYLSGGLSSNNGLHAYTHVVVAVGEKTMAEMRELAGVS